MTSTTASNNCASGSTDARCSNTVGVSILTIAQTASPASTTPGSVVNYTITVTNSGTVAYTGAALTDSLSGVLDDAIYNSDGATTAGSLTFSSPNLTWTGNLAAGASATITFSVTVNSPDTGEQGPGQHDHLGHGGQQLRERQHRHPVCQQRDGAGAGPDDRRVGRQWQHDAGVGGALHGDGDQLRADRLYRGDVHRSAVGGA